LYISIRLNTPERTSKVSEGVLSPPSYSPLSLLLKRGFLVSIITRARAREPVPTGEKKEMVFEWLLGVKLLKSYSKVTQTYPKLLKLTQN